MKKLFCILGILVSACASIHSRGPASLTNTTTQDNIGFGLEGSWYEPNVTYTGFNIGYNQRTSGPGDVVVYWYTYGTNGTTKLWYIMQGTLVGNMANLTIYTTTNGNYYSNTAQLKTIGTGTITLTDCNNSVIQWFLTNNQETIPNSGTKYLTRLSPILSANGMQLCLGGPFSASGSNYASNCIVNLSQIRASWGASDLQLACGSNPTNCASLLAQTRASWGPNDLAVACANNPSVCAASLAQTRASWGPNDLAVACANSNTDCASQLAQTEPSWGPDNLAMACANNTQNCAASLAPLRPSWGPNDIATACNGTNGSCVIGLAQTRPSWSPTDLQNSCR